jgi:hypothetical protein
MINGFWLRNFWEQPTLLEFHNLAFGLATADPFLILWQVENQVQEMERHGL